MLSGLLIKINSSFKILLAVIGLASMYPVVAIDNVSLYRDNDSIFIQFDTESFINDSIMQIIDSGVIVNFTYSVTTTANGKLLLIRDYVEQVSTDKGFYRINGGNLLTLKALKKRMSRHEFKVYKIKEGFNAYKLKTEIDFGLSCRETPELLKLWGNRPKITVNFTLNQL